MSIGIKVEHPVTHVHTQNGLAESLIKRLQLIARPLLMKCNLPSSAWGHTILHAAALIRLRPTASHKFSPLQLVFRIYIGFHSLSIIKYLEPLTEDVSTSCFADCQFDEIIFPILGGEKENNLECIINILS
jgi:hypothetical protein